MNNHLLNTYSLVCVLILTVSCSSSPTDLENDTQLLLDIVDKTGSRKYVPQKTIIPKFQYRSLKTPMDIPSETQTNNNNEDEFEDSITLPTVQDMLHQERSHPSEALPLLRKMQKVSWPSTSSKANEHWQRIMDGFQLEGHRNRLQVKEKVRYYTRKPKALFKISKRATIFLPMILEAVQRYDMPTELVLLPFVESGFQLQVVSSAKAAGLWQFIPATGKRYGLAQSKDYDGRLNPHSSTKAALQYLRDLNKRFDGDWLLALAAYNAGEGRVEKAIAKNRRANKPTDFWSLKLPKETQNYIPRLLAYREIVKNAANYNVDLAPISTSTRLRPMKIKHRVNLNQLSSLANLPKKNLLQRLNPGFKIGIAAPNYDNYIVVPDNYRTKIKKAILSSHN